MVTFDGGSGRIVLQVRPPQALAAVAQSEEGSQLCYLLGCCTLVEIVCLRCSGAQSPQAEH